jgi:hypothetical protein
LREEEKFALMLVPGSRRDWHGEQVVYLIGSFVVPFGEL